MIEKLKSAPLAYQNEAFLDSPDGRVLRILAEYQEPLARFRRERIQDTVVFFGAARFQGSAPAQSTLTELDTRRAEISALEHEKSRKLALAGVDMAPPPQKR